MTPDQELLMREVLAEVRAFRLEFPCIQNELRRVAGAYEEIRGRVEQLEEAAHEQ